MLAVWVPRRKRLFLISACAVVLVSIYVIVSLVLSFNHHQQVELLKANFEKIEIGKNVSDVAELLGRNADRDQNYDKTPRRDCSWIIHGYRLDVICTRDGVITEKHLSELYRPGPIDHLTRWLTGRPL